MWKLLSKASLAAAVAALAVTTMSAPASAQGAPTNPSEALDKVTSLIPGQSPAADEDATKTTPGTPVPLPRPLPDSGEQNSDQPDKAQPSDGSLDVVALPKQLVDQLPQSGVVPPELANQVRDFLGERLDGVGSIELPDRRLTTDPNGDLVVLDPKNAVDDGVVSADRPVKAQQATDGGAPAANLGAILQGLLQPNGPLAGLQGLNGGLQ